MSTTTFVTALFDIGRERHDGRRFQEYLGWFYKTLEIHADLVCFVEPEIEEKVRQKRLSTVASKRGYLTLVVPATISGLSTHGLLPAIRRVIGSPEYRAKIRDVRRYECNSAEYNVLIFGKFDLLKRIAVDNPFGSDTFFWIDAGCSRFLADSCFATPFRLLDHPLLMENTFYVQGHADPYDAHKIGPWDDHSVIWGAMFGGQKKPVIEICTIALQRFRKMVTEQGIVNNEQVVLQILAQDSPDRIQVIYPNSSEGSFDLLCRLNKNHRFDTTRIPLRSEAMSPKNQCGGLGLVTTSLYVVLGCAMVVTVFLFYLTFRHVA